MAEPSRRASRLTIAGVTLALIAAGAAGFGLGRTTGRKTPAPPVSTPATPSPSPTPAPVLPTVQPTLGRAELIAAAADAADAFAAGGSMPDLVTQLAGRPFELRLPFGCPGSPEAGAAGALGVEYDETAQVLRVRAEPVSWQPRIWWPDAETLPEGDTVAESIEGFWISRPWTSSEACPAPTGAATPPAPAEQTLGIAQFFTRASSRVGRRNGKPYEAVESVAPEELNVSRGLRLRLRGKLGQGLTGGPVLCRALGPARPVCIVSVTFDEVAIENPATGATLATWDVSSQTQDPTSR